MVCRSGPGRKRRELAESVRPRARELAADLGEKHKHWPERVRVRVLYPFQPLALTIVYNVQCAAREPRTLTIAPPPRVTHQR